MDWLYYILLLLVQVIGLALALFQMPGLWLMLVGVCVYAWGTASRGYVAGHWLIGLLLLTLLAEVVEFVAGGAGAKKAGASKLAMAGAMVGGIVGAIAGTFIPVPIIGTIVGACLGSFAFAMAIQWMQNRDVSHSMRVGVGAFKGRFFGIVGKLTIGVLILVITFVVALPVGGIALPPTAPTVILLPATDRRRHHQPAQPRLRDFRIAICNLRSQTSVSIAYRKLQIENSYISRR